MMATLKFLSWKNAPNSLLADAYGHTVGMATDLVVTRRCPAWQSHLLGPLEAEGQLEGREEREG